MPHIHYYVATSLDGYISGPGGDISLFAQEGPGVDRYLSDLQSYQTVIMGRHTYEFGYAFFLTPGQPAYPHMEHHIFSKSLKFDDAHAQVHVHELEAEGKLTSLLENGDLGGEEGYMCQIVYINQLGTTRKTNFVTPVQFLYPTRKKSYESAGRYIFRGEKYRTIEILIGWQQRCVESAHKNSQTLHFQCGMEIYL